MKKSLSLITLTLLSVLTTQANAAIRITEVAPWASSGSNTAYAADWFELTNTGSSSINITGWKVDDSSNSFATAFTLNGITSIAAGESVIFIESASGAAIPTFKSTWFGTNPAPSIGFYSGSQIGLSTGGDAVNIFNASGVNQASVNFAGSDEIAPYQTFDNAAGLNNTAISLLSIVGTNGAFVALNNVNEVGSPGRVAAPVPEAESYAMLLAGLGVIGAAVRRRKAS